MGTNYRLQFETVNNDILLTTGIPDNGLQLYSTSYAVRSAITATAEILVQFISEPHNVT